MTKIMIVMGKYEDSYEPISIMKCHKGFVEVAQLVSFNHVRYSPSESLNKAVCCSVCVYSLTYC